MCPENISNENFTQVSLQNSQQQKEIVNCESLDKNETLIPVDNNDKNKISRHLESCPPVKLNTPNVSRMSRKSMEAPVIELCSKESLKQDKSPVKVQTGTPKLTRSGRMVKPPHRLDL
ncbi:unnamed protein product, partial [Brenthis ino]